MTLITLFVRVSDIRKTQINIVQPRFFEGRSYIDLSSPTVKSVQPIHSLTLIHPRIQIPHCVTRSRRHPSTHSLKSCHFCRYTEKGTGGRIHKTTYPCTPVS